jgi:hypothetical protein
MPRNAPYQWRTYAVTVRAQVILQREGRDWVFLAPAPADVLSYNPANHAEPDFAKAKQPFWANEQTHPDSQP